MTTHIGSNTQEVRALIAKLEAQRQASMDLLLNLTDEDLDFWYTDQTAGQEEGPFTIRRLLHRITTHHEDHLQHILRARRNLGVPRNETARAMARVLASRTELICALLGLTDEDLHKDISEGYEMGNVRPDEANWPDADKTPEYTIARVMQHVVEKEEMRLAHVRQALDMGKK
jgi:hypothetical protein